MEANPIKIKVGDRVVISRPSSTHRFATIIERVSEVSAVRPKSFDAGGLCFRYDGREWKGHCRVRPIPAPDELKQLAASARGDDAASLERAERAREDVMLALLLTYRHENDWLKLGIHELRRIAALHGIASTRARVLETSGLDAHE